MLSYLASGDELQRPQRTAHVWDIGLKVVERIGDVGLDLRGVLTRRAVGRDLVEGGGRHFCFMFWSDCCESRCCRERECWVVCEEGNSKLVWDF